MQCNLMDLYDRTHRATFRVLVAIFVSRNSGNAELDLQLHTARDTRYALSRCYARRLDPKQNKAKL